MIIMTDQISVKLQTVLYRNLSFVGDGQAFPMQTDLEELGLDSMGAINLLLDLEQSFGIIFPDALLTAETFQNGASLDHAIRSLVNG